MTPEKSEEKKLIDYFTNELRATYTPLVQQLSYPTEDKRISVTRSHFDDLISLGEKSAEYLRIETALNDVNKAEVACFMSVVSMILFAAIAGFYKLNNQEPPAGTIVMGLAASAIFCAAASRVVYMEKSGKRSELGTKLSQYYAEVNNLLNQFEIEKPYASDVGLVKKIAQESVGLVSLLGKLNIEEFTFYAEDREFNFGDSADEV